MLPHKSKESILSRDPTSRELIETETDTEAMILGRNAEDRIQDRSTRLLTRLGKSSRSLVEIL